MSPELMVFSTGLTPEQHTCFLCMTHPCLLMPRHQTALSAPSLGATLNSMITNKKAPKPQSNLPPDRPGNKKVQPPPLSDCQGQACWWLKSSTALWISSNI